MSLRVSGQWQYAAPAVTTAASASVALGMAATLENGNFRLTFTLAHTYKVEQFVSRRLQLQ